MGYYTFDQAEQKYQAEIKRLDKIAQHVVNSDRGKFVRTLADAWLEADKSNKRIIKPGWEAIIIKYDLYTELQEDKR